MAAQRNTVQKVLVREALHYLCHPTAEEVYGYVHERQPSVSKATLYRNLKTMSETGTIRKINTLEGAARYDDATRPHFHGKCRICGKMFDIEMDSGYADALRAKVKDSHGFLVEGQKLIFTGVCPECNGGGKQ
ncbi:MAG: transcriptional repressor [Eubacteriaceae bacterium]|nr:transcriptional repressor [Eubacteriaceae bacterium]